MALDLGSLDKYVRKHISDDFYDYIYESSPVFERLNRKLDIFTGIHEAEAPVQVEPAKPRKRRAPKASSPAIEFPSRRRIILP